MCSYHINNKLSRYVSIRKQKNYLIVAILQGKKQDKKQYKKADEKYTSCYNVDKIELSLVIQNVCLHFLMVRNI